VSSSTTSVGNSTSLASLASELASPQTSTTGSSTFASDLQSSVTRAIEIASLPMEALQDDVTTISGQTSELSTLGNLFDSLQTSLQAIGSGTTGSSAVTASVSNTSVLTADVTGSALPGTYSVDVTTAGSFSSAISNSSTAVTDPTSEDISGSSTFTLTVGSSTYNVTADNLDDLASAINESGAAVQAEVINEGTPESPNYQLSLQATGYGDVNLQLNDGTNNLLTSTGTGQDAVYTVDGEPSGGITSDSPTVTLASGLTANLEAAGSTTVTVSSSLSAVSSELSSFVSAYNSAFTELEKNFGTNGGALVGDSSVLEMQQVMNQIVGYVGSGSGSINSLAQLGVEFTQQGTLTFDASAISSLSQSQINDAISFLGNVNSGGYLQYANNLLNNITDPTAGVIATETQTLDNQSSNDQTQITTDQAQLTTMQTNLDNQISEANALIATLENQTTFLEGLFQADTSNNQNASEA
jgi:flagellar hook-associated protein 2